ncbi:MAG: hypothetical protein ACHP7O_03070 [Burkholderiales bacterium]
MKISHSIMSVCISLTLAACGGGGSSGTTTSSTSGTPTTAVTALNPYTNQVAPGALTNTIAGIVWNSRTVGAIVSAYQVMPNGTNGALIGTSGATGADGSFTMTISTQSTGYVRLVSTGGTYTSEADGTTQAGGSLELVTPYVTTAFNSFVITPVTHIASHVFTFKAGQGATLATSYTTGISTALQLAGEDTPLRGTTDLGVNILKTMPASSDDLLNAYQDLLTAIEWFGVQYDLPSTTSVRVISSNAEVDYPIPSLVDGSNNQINVGTWVNGTFNDGASGLTLTKMMSSLSVASEIQYPLLSNFYEYAACQNASAIPAYLARFPSQTTIFTADPDHCAELGNSIAALKAQILTNNRTKYAI